MKKISSILAAVGLASALFTGSAQAGVPFVNLEGVGGVAYNPLAYTANTPAKKGEEGLKIGGIDVSKPRIGTWFVNLHDTDINWFSGGAATTIANRLEVSYGHESIATKLAGGNNIQKNNFGAKLLLLEENSFGTNYLPAISVGTTYKTTTFTTGAGQYNEGLDAYLVATKLIKELPVPVLISAGVLSGNGQVNGILGFNEQRKTTVFANIDVLPISSLAIGLEYKQGPSYGTWKDADKWNVHVGWFVNEKLTLIAAYANAGNRNSTKSVGLSDGPVVSLQYAF